MAVAVRLTCDAGQITGEPCPAQVSIAVRDGYEATIDVLATRGGGQELVMEETNIDVPGLWRFSPDGERVFCPEHNSAA